MRLANYNQPILNINDTNICLGDTILLDATCNNCTYRWFDNSSSPLKYVSAPSINEIRIYYAANCELLKQVKIDLDNSKECEPIIYAPNAFSPDEDGYNEVFKIEGFGIVDVELQIFNRWGEQIYFETGINPAWNGDYLSIPCQTGLYIWQAKVKTIDNKVRFARGHVNLLR